MGDRQAFLADGQVVEKQDVDVDLPGTPAIGLLPPDGRLDRLGRDQQLTRDPWPLNLQHLVQEARLTEHPERLRLVNRALSQDPGAARGELGPRPFQVAAAVAQVGSQRQVAHGHRSASATRATRAIARTSWTRTTSAPRRIATTTEAAVPSTRSSTGRSRIRPRKDLREVPTSSGRSSDSSSARRRRTTRFCSAVFPKPIPGSTRTRSPRQPPPRRTAPERP